MRYKVAMGETSDQKPLAVNVSKKIYIVIKSIVSR